MSEVRVFIQARMTSSRFPGKVLAPLQGRPILWHVIECIKKAGIADEDTVVLTSDEPTDDPVAAYAAALGIPVFRGSLQNVMERFVGATEAHPCDWILRATADSPFYQPELIQFVAATAGRTTASFVTTTHRRTLPKGMNVEMIRTCLLRETFSLPDITDHDREHLTSRFHRMIPASGVCSIELSDADFSHTSMAVDSIEDLAALGEKDALETLNAIPWDQLRETLVHS
jgi:spore coat polysaccharide biosynthesis protein SpsF